MNPLPAGHPFTGAVSIRAQLELTVDTRIVEQSGATPAAAAILAFKPGAATLAPRAEPASDAAASIRQKTATSAVAKRRVSDALPSTNVKARRIALLSGEILTAQRMAGNNAQPVVGAEEKSERAVGDLLLEVAGNVEIEVGVAGPPDDVVRDYGSDDARPELASSSDAADAPHCRPQLSCGHAPEAAAGARMVEDQKAGRYQRDALPGMLCSPHPDRLHGCVGPVTQLGICTAQDVCSHFQR